MSDLTDFMSSMAGQAAPIIGTNKLAIGSGAEVDVVSAEARHDRSHEMNGFQRSASLPVIILKEDFELVYTADLKTYIGKVCTHKSDNWRIGDVEEGDSFVRLMLVDRTETA